MKKYLTIKEVIEYFKIEDFDNSVRNKIRLICKNNLIFNFYISNSYYIRFEDIEAIKLILFNDLKLKKTHR